MTRKKEFSILIGILILLLVVPHFASASHYIIGYVNDSRSGIGANDRVMTLWNPANGIDDNLTDIIGVNGNSGADNFYMIDCELLDSPCSIFDTINVKVFDNGSNYITNTGSLVVTGAGFDQMTDLIIINSKPNTTLLSPVNHANLSTSEVNFSCTSEDLDSNLENVTIYGNWGGGWHANETTSISGSFINTNFTKTLTEGTYEWNCLSTDNLSISQFASSNNTVTVDLTPPTVSSIELNESGNICGTSSYIKVNCTATDVLTGIESVIIESSNHSGKQNHSTTLLAGNTYYSDILVDDLGEWNFRCIANDSAGNQNNLTDSQYLNINSDSVDLKITSNDLNFSNLDPIENTPVIINATIHNIGCSNSGNFVVGFYRGDPDSGGTQINGNITASVTALSNTTINATWLAEIGTTNVFVEADFNDSISESNETNNKANKTISVGAWQEIYGNTTINKLLSDSNLMNMSLWSNETTLSGNIFITDTESQISWTSLQAIGRDTSNLSTANDFIEIDTLLDMTSFEDSVSNIFTTDGNTPLEKENFSIHRKQINEVPIINSTNNANFKTGILWDTDDDTNTEYDSTDQEDLVFVAKINPNSQGDYGIYDYEITIPVRLREYNATATNEVFIYFDLN